MLFVSLLQWWYRDGWLRRARIVNGHIESMIDYFSIGLLLKTLFQPFRQIDAGGVDGPLEVKIRAFFDKLVSRCIGAAIRLVILTIGVITIALISIVGLLILLLWAFVPLLPVIGVIMTIIGWTPRW